MLLGLKEEYLDERCLSITDTQPGISMHSVASVNRLTSKYSNTSRQSIRSIRKYSRRGSQTTSTAPRVTVVSHTKSEGKM